MLDTDKSRDEFAAQAMHALLSNTSLNLVFKLQNGGAAFNDFTEGRHGERRVSAKSFVARMSYEMADAMIRERDTQSTPRY